VPSVLDAPPAATSQQVLSLREVLRGPIPAKVLDRNPLIGTWNIRAFGGLTEVWESSPADSPKRDLTLLLCIAEVLRCFDVVAVQEVRGNLKGLRDALKVLGPQWGSSSPMSPGATRETTSGWRSCSTRAGSNRPGWRASLYCPNPTAGEPGQRFDSSPAPPMR